jgi:hypothetical protein
MPRLYWRELGQLKAAAIYMRLYRNELAKRVRAVEIVKAVASSSALTVALETLFIEAEAEWQNIEHGKIPAEAITERRMLLQKHRLELEQRNFPEGFEPKPRLVELASAEAEAYFKLTYTEDA